jgi:hypothetical protein
MELSSQIVLQMWTKNEIRASKAVGKSDLGIQLRSSMVFSVAAGRTVARLPRN